MYKSHFLLIGAIWLVAMTAAADVWYVDKSNDSGTEDGLAWATAFTTIQAAINAAEMYGEVWVAEGVYDEVRISVMHDPPEDTGSLVMKDGVLLYGGFAGTELDRLERAAWCIALSTAPVPDPGRRPVTWSSPLTTRPWTASA